MQQSFAMPSETSRIILESSLSELAKKTATNKGSWSRWLNGQFVPSVPSLQKISQALDINIDSALVSIEQRRKKN